MILFSCEIKKDGFTITGHIDGVKDSTYIRLYDMDQQLNLDSAYLKNGDFHFSGKVKYPTGCFIMCENEYASIQLENLDISFQAPFKDMYSNCVIKAGREQEFQNELKKLQKPFEQINKEAYDSLVNKLYTNKDERRRLVKKYNESYSSIHEIYVNYGRTHADSYFGLNIVYSNRQDITKDSLVAIFEKLSASLKTSEAGKGLNVYLYERTTGEGEPFIDFDAKTIESEDFKLSSLKGNYIYLYFWNVGCEPCRMENKFLSENFHDIPKDLSVVSFSTTKNMKAWQKASKSDNMIWNNVSDGEGDTGRVKTQYQVQAIPTSFLIDKDGTIIKKFIGFDPDGNIIEDIKKLIEEKRNGSDKNGDLTMN